MCALAHKELHGTGVEVCHVVLGRGTALDKVQVGVVLDDNERVLKLAGALGVEAEVALQREVELGALGHVDKRAARPHGAVQGRKLVVGGWDERHKLLVDERLPLRVVQGLLNAGVDDAHLGRRVLHVVVDELGVVLRADACQVAALGLGDTQALKGVLDVVGHRLPVVLLVGVGLDVSDDVVHVQALDGGAPRRIRETVEDLEGLEAQVEHPLRLVLLGADLAHDVGRDAGVEALESLLAIGEVVEAAVDVRDLGAVLGHCVAPLRLLLGSGGLGLGALLGGLALEGLKTILVDPGDERGIVLAHDVALDHNVDAVDIQVLQDARVVRDDEHGAVAALAVRVHAVADGGQGVDVQA